MVITLKSWTAALKLRTNGSSNLVLDLNAKVAPMGTASQVDWGLAVERESVIRPLAEEEKPPTDDYQRL